MTNLTDKAIDIKGKKYVLVSDRILAFNKDYPNGSIQTEIISPVDAEMVVFRATVTIGSRVFTGHSQATWGDGYINKTSAIENAETSAVGRALAMMGIGVIDSVASVDEINKTTHPRPQQPVRTANTPDAMQKQLLNLPCKKCGGEMAMSSKGNVYCKAMCWEKTNSSIFGADLTPEEMHMGTALSDKDMDDIERSMR